MGKLPKSIIAVCGVVGLAVVLAIVVAGSRGGEGGAATDASGQEHGLRTVLVSEGGEPKPSPPGPVLHALRLKGTVPGRTMIATVLTDEDCAPDREGVSHCVNRLRIAGGGTLVVRHPHRMMDVACLTPGERVLVRRS